jgi:predicted transposase/invertase (TIGR01784 family)
VILNDDTVINIEMQVGNFGNWPERALSYLCRSYDNLKKGEDYNDVKKAIHIGFLDFTLFAGYPEFYATYRMMNEKNHHIFSDRLLLGVVDMKRVDLATDEDKLYGIDKWVSLFKAQTWEELKALGAQNAIFNEVGEAVFKFSMDDEVMEQCRKAEEHMREFQYLIDSNKTKDATIESLKTTVDSQNTTIDGLKAIIENQNTEMAKMRDDIEKLSKILNENHDITKN